MFMFLDVFNHFDPEILTSKTSDLWTEVTLYVIVVILVDSEAKKRTDERHNVSWFSSIV